MNTEGELVERLRGALAMRCAFGQYGQHANCGCGSCQEIRSVQMDADNYLRETAQAGALTLECTCSPAKTAAGMLHASSCPRSEPAPEAVAAPGGAAGRAGLLDVELADLEQLAEHTPGVVGHRALTLVRDYRALRQRLAAAESRAAELEREAEATLAYYREQGMVTVEHDGNAVQRMGASAQIALVKLRAERHALAERLAAVERAFAPVNDWYQPDEQPERPLSERVADAVDDLQLDRGSTFQLADITADRNRLAAALALGEAEVATVRRQCGEYLRGVIDAAYFDGDLTVAGKDWFTSIADDWAPLVVEAQV